VSARKFAIGVLVAAGVVAIAGGIATARIKTESKSASVPTDQNAKASAKCPRGSEAVAGGFDVPGVNSTIEATVFHFGSKRGGGRKWKTQSHNFGGPDRNMKSIAYCDTHQPNLSVESKSKSLDPGNGSVTASCPRGSEAISGGWATKGDSLQLAFESRRKGERKWKVSALNFGDTGPLVAFVYCDNHGPNLKTASDSVNVPARDLGSAKANCRQGEKAYSGGYKGQSPAPLDGPFAFVSKRTGGGDWKAKAFGNQDTGSLKFKVYAYCK
jgi:hypothetical protein